MSPTYPQHTKQAGAVLFVSLMLLIVMTLLGINGMQSTILEEKMSGNLRDKSIAFQSAESAIKNAENHIAFNDLRYSFPAVAGSCANGLCQPSATVTPVWRNWPAANAADYASIRNNTPDLLLNGLTMNNFPQYIIEKVNNLPLLAGNDSLDIGQSYGATEQVVYRITGRGLGGADTTEVKTQSLYIR